MSAEWVAQAAASSGDVQEVLTRVLPWTAAVVAALVLLAAWWGYYRRHSRRADEGRLPTWTLQELWDMRARGDLADDEYQRLRTRVLASGTPSGGTGNDSRSGRLSRDKRPSRER